MTATQGAQDAAPQQQIPYGAEWQRLFVHELVDDDRFGDLMAAHVEARYLDNEIAQWVVATCAVHRQRYGVQPSWAALEEYARRLEPGTRQLYVLGLEQIRQAPTRDAMWVRATAVDWVKRNVFARGFLGARDLFNANKVDAAYDSLMREMDRFNDVVLDSDAVEESWLFEDLPRRQAERASNLRNTATPTGIPQLDQLLGGGLDLGMLGIWMAYSKVGKTTMLINLGRVAVRACMRNVAHFYFEGTQKQITNRYDASFSAELYNAVKRGDFGGERYYALWQEYQHYQRKLYVRGFRGRWDYSVLDIWEALERLRRREGWEPDVLIVDYADLLRGRGSHANEWDSNAAAYRDLKTLAEKRRGYALWTAAQAKKPQSDTYDTVPHVLKSNDLGGRYEKVKVADFLASMNATLEERSIQGLMRVWVEAVRDNPAGREFTVPVDHDRMLFGLGAGLDRQPYGAMPQMGGAPPSATAAPAAIGYRQATVPLGDVR